MLSSRTFRIVNDRNRRRAKQSQLCVSVKEAQKFAWAVAENFHHATIFQEGDPLLDLVLQGYEKTDMKGTTNRFGTAAKALNHNLVKSYPESRVAVSTGPSTCEWFCTVFYELLKDKLNIKKIY